MGKTKNGSSANRPELVIGDITNNSGRLVQAFPQTSAIGFAVLDHKLRYQAINSCLAHINGTPAQEHLGNNVRDLFGEISRKTAEPTYQRVLSHAEITHFEVKNAALPKRTDSRYWGLNTNFPIRDRTGAIKEIGILVIDVTEQRRLELFLAELVAELRHMHKREMLQLVRELHGAMDEYHATLISTLKFVIASSQDSQPSYELLEEQIARLDQRLLKMRGFVSSVAARFQIARRPL